MFLLLTRRKMLARDGEILSFPEARYLFQSVLISLLVK